MRLGSKIAPAALLFAFAASGCSGNSAFKSSGKSTKPSGGTTASITTTGDTDGDTILGTGAADNPLKLPIGKSKSSTDLLPRDAVVTGCESADTAIATCDDKTGEIHAVALGSTIVTIQTKDGPHQVHVNVTSAAIGGNAGGNTGGETGGEAGGATGNVGGAGEEALKQLACPADSPAGTCAKQFGYYLIVKGTLVKSHDAASFNCAGSPTQTHMGGSASCPAGYVYLSGGVDCQIPGKNGSGGGGILLTSVAEPADNPTSWRADCCTSGDNTVETYESIYAICLKLDFFTK